MLVGSKVLFMLLYEWEFTLLRLFQLIWKQRKIPQQATPITPIMFGNTTEELKLKKKDLKVLTDHSNWEERLGSFDP